MENIGSKGNYTWYANDTVIVYSGYTKEVIESTIIYDISKIGNWLRTNVYIYI